MRYGMALIVVVMLIGCASGAAGGQAATPEPDGTPIADAAAAATAAALPLECVGASEWSVASIAEGTGSATAEEALQEFIANEALPYATLGFTHRTERRVVWVFVNEQGDKVQQANGSQLSDGLWYIESSGRCISNPALATWSIALTPDNAATAAALPLECPHLIEEMDAAIDEGSGSPTPEEALEAFKESYLGLYEHTAITYTHRTEDEVRWVYLDGEGRKVQEIKAGLMPWGLWVIESMERCHEGS